MVHEGFFLIPLEDFKTAQEIEHMLGKKEKSPNTQIKVTKTFPWNPQKVAIPRSLIFGRPRKLARVETPTVSLPHFNSHCVPLSGPSPMVTPMATNVKKVVTRGGNPITTLPTKHNTVKWKGLTNLGQTCWFNAIVQCLCTWPSLKNFCCSHNQREFKGVNGKAIQHFCDLYKSLANPNSTETWINPRKCYDAMKGTQILGVLGFKKGKLGYAGEDVSECFLAIYQFLRTIVFGIEQNTTFLLQTTLMCLSCGVERGKEPTLYGPPIVLNFAIKYADKQEVYLQSMIRTYFLEASTGGNTICVNCLKKGVTKQKFSLITTPNYVVFLINRFTKQEKISLKNNTKVSFPNILSLQPFLLESKNTGQHEYILTGVIEHVGNDIAQGHWRAYVFKEPLWLLCDDSRVEIVENQYVKNVTPYMLFYTHKDGF